MYKLIPLEERHKYRCCVCGETKSVKYLIPTHNPLEGEEIHDLPYCNRCALLHSALTEKNKEITR
jgi:hypothetical protein